MIKYLTNSNLSLRLNINPFQWNWKPFFEHEPPSEIYPKRRTIGCGWIFIQVFIDIDNGEFNSAPIMRIMRSQEPMDIHDEP